MWVNQDKIRFDSAGLAMTILCILVQMVDMDVQMHMV